MNASQPIKDSPSDPSNPLDPQACEEKIKAWLDSKQSDVRLIMEELKSLPRLIYEQYCYDVSKQAKVRLSTLDEAVEKRES